MKPANSYSLNKAVTVSKDISMELSVSYGYEEKEEMEWREKRKQYNKSVISE